MKKPPPVVLAVNRAARDRPQAARSAVEAAERLARIQLSGRSDEYRMLVAEMNRASALLGEVALANLSTGAVSETIRRRTAEHIRGALSSTETRDLLVRGTLTNEVAASGFDAFDGAPTPRSKTRLKQDARREARREAKARARQLQAEIRAVRRELSAAVRRVNEATEAREMLAAHLGDLESQLAGLGDP